MVINSSDAASDKNASLMGQIQQHTLEAIEVGNEKFPNALQILSDIPARTGFTTEAMEAERRALNAWMYTLPGGPSGVDAVIRLADLLGDGGDPERLKPEYTIDGIHWTPAGIAVVVQQIIVTRQAPSAAAIPETVLASLRGAGSGHAGRRRLQRSVPGRSGFTLRCRRHCDGHPASRPVRRPVQRADQGVSTSRDRQRRTVPHPLSRWGTVAVGVADGTRTRDSQDHNLVLYQLNYSHHRRRAVTRRQRRRS